MIVGSIGGVAVLYELVWIANQGQLEARLHSPSNVFIGAACLLMFGWGLALVAPRVGRWFALFTLAGAAAAGAIAASGTESAFAPPLFGAAAAAGAVVFASYRGERQARRARTA